jgi:uncharacterized membrane protein
MKSSDNELPIMTLNSAKNVGGVGSLLLVISGLLFVIGMSILVVGLLVIVGVMLILVALAGMADFYKDKKIFRYALYALITGIIGITALFITMTLTSNALNAIANEHITDLRTIASQEIATTNLMLNSELVIVLVFPVVTMLLFKSSLGRLSTKTNVNLFGITGWFMLVAGIVTAIIVNPILMWAGCVLLTIAFFSLREGHQQPNIKLVKEGERHV